jgi:hypothetical protein
VHHQAAWYCSSHLAVRECRPVSAQVRCHIDQVLLPLDGQHTLNLKLGQVQVGVATPPVLPRLTQELLVAHDLDLQPQHIVGGSMACPY